MIGNHIYTGGINTVYSPGQTTVGTTWTFKLQRVQGRSLQCDRPVAFSDVSCIFGTGQKSFEQKEEYKHIIVFHPFQLLGSAQHLRTVLDHRPHL